MFFPFARYRIVGHSMEPLFNEGDKVIINRLSYLFSSPKRGDIIAFRAKNQVNKILLKKIDKVLGYSNYSVVGFNRSDTLDSSNIGTVKRGQILGKVFFKY